MSEFISALKELLGRLFMSPFGEPGFFIAAFVAALGLYLTSSWILRTIYSQQRNMFWSFFAVLTALLATLALAAAYRAWGSPHVSNGTADTVLFVLSTGAGFALGAWLARFFIGIKFGSALAFLVSVAVVGFVLIFCTAHLYTAVAGAINKLGNNQELRTTLPS